MEIDSEAGVWDDSFPNSCFRVDFHKLLGAFLYPENPTRMRQRIRYCTIMRRHGKTAEAVGVIVNIVTSN